MASSPFRYDSTPSFFVDLREDGPFYGCWADSGAIDPEFAGGNFVTLLSFLRRETPEETIDYLRAMYGPADAYDTPQLRPIRLTTPTVRRPLNTDVIRPFIGPCDYLTNRRGIPEEIQRKFRTGFDASRKAVIIPWYLPDGRLGNVKYRRIDAKLFWFAKGGIPIRSMLYGLDIVYRERINRAAIVEAEIDAMSLAAAGIPAIAVGGTSFGPEKRDLIIRSPIEELVILRDNDAAGRKLQREIVRELAGHVRLRIAIIPNNWRCKDANDVLVRRGGDALAACAGRARSVKLQQEAFKIYLLKNI